MSLIPDEHNSVATFLANHGLSNIPSFTEISGYFGNLYELIRLDMGWGPLSPSFDPLQNCCRGEIININEHSISPQQSEASAEGFSIPCRSKRSTSSLADTEKKTQKFNLPNQKMNKQIILNIHLNLLCVSKEDTVVPPQTITKGKEKVSEGHAFNKDSLLSKEAINLLDSGALNFISKKLGKIVINMDEKTIKNLTTK